MFLPLVDGGLFVKDDIIRWFDILDDKEQRIINHNQ